MAAEQESIKLLMQKLEALIAKQSYFAYEIKELKSEINKLKENIITSTEEQNIETDTKKEQQEEKPIFWNPSKANKAPIEIIDYIKPITATPKPLLRGTTSHSKGSIEKFIGENLISKIGIIITVIGVAIGAKYSIEHDLIKPMTRIILGYFMGLSLLGIGIYLKNKYINYSAVLVSGAMAILYFITFSACSFYHIFSIKAAFGLMLLFTIFTVYASIYFNNQIIALIGMVGAYAIPFLLSNGDNNVLILFSYMSILNIGILAIAIKKYWKQLYYLSFAITWLIFLSWYLFNSDKIKDFNIAFTFSIIFFIIFYSVFLMYKLINKEKFGSNDVVLLLLNSFIFYSIGFSILSENNYTDYTLGIFTFCNALLHYLVSYIISKNKLSDKNLMNFIAGLVLVFITLVFPVIFNGNWVTVFWASEAALLYWIGVSKDETIYEKLSYPIMLLALLSIIEDWSTLMNSGIYNEKINPIFNPYFLSGVLFIACFSIINYLKFYRKSEGYLNKKKNLYHITNYGIPLIFLVSIYFTFQLEIECYFQQLYIKAFNKNDYSFQSNKADNDILIQKLIWTINYTFVFLSLLSIFNIYKLQNKKLGIVNIFLNTIAFIVFLLIVQFKLYQLKEHYLLHINNSNSFFIIIRYITYSLVALLFVITYKYIKQSFMLPIDKVIKIILECLLYISILWVASMELMMLLEMNNSKQSNKLGVTIFWGLYAMLLIFLGIWKKKFYLRIMGFVIFGITLIKLFLYDIAHLDTISKTIVFVSLGVFLLIISFIYNKYKKLIFEDYKEE